MKHGSPHESNGENGDAAVLPALPCGWFWTTLETIAEIEGGITKDQKRQRTKTSRKVPYLRVANVQRGFLDLGEIKTILADEAEIESLRLRKGDILFTEGGDRDKLGRGWVWADELDECIHQNHIFRARPRSSDFSSKFISYHGNHFGQEWFTRTGKQTTNLASINKGVLRRFPVPVPPAKEQRRIVEKIEELFSDLDAGVAALERAKANLKRYRASVLKAAVEGNLTAAWRAEHPNIRPAALPVATTAKSATKKRAGRLWGSGMVPPITEEERKRIGNGWCWAKVRQLGSNPDETVQVGPMSMRSQDFESAGVPVLNVGCVQWDRFEERKLDFLPREKAAAFDRYRLRQEDVLFTRSGTVGRCAVVEGHQDGWLMTFHLLRVRPNPKICLSRYLRMVFEGASHVRRQTRNASIGTTRAGFNTNLLADLDVPLPPIEEQSQIVAEVAEKLSQIEAAGVAIDHGLARAARLRQSILKRAFAGQLVPQDPHDEPATALLARVSATQGGAASMAKRKASAK